MSSVVSLRIDYYHLSSKWSLYSFCYLMYSNYDV